MRDRNKWKCILVSILFLCIGVSAFAQDNNELKQTAENKFENGEYKEAMAFYSQLTSFYPKDAFYNYRLGACMVIVESDKNKALKYLEYAVSKPEVNNEANYYMGLAYHYNYRFKEAKVYYNKFKTNANRRQLKDFEVERQLRMCNNGEELLSNISDLEVLESKKVDRENFQLSYRLSSKMGRILKVPAELLTNQDEKEELKTLMHRTSGDYVYYASYGENDETGLDLFRARLENGELGTPQRLPGVINTPYDEEFPYMDPSGTKFYFASKGHTSMGGYDIFVADYDSTTDQWSAPRNLDFAVNTPDDDILYVIDENEENAFFSSTRNIVKGNIHFYQIKAGKQPIQFNLLIGQFDASSGNVATITVENRSDGTKIGSYTTQRETGKYTMRLPNGGKFKFIVEVAGSDKIHTGMVETPFLTEFRPLKQEMKVVEENGSERLIIKNIFDQPLTDEDRLLMAQELVQKSKLSADDQTEKSFDREELVTTIQKEAEAAEKSAGEFNKQAANLYQLASAQTKLANDELILAEEIASSVQDFDQPSAEDEAKISEINQLRRETKKHSTEAHLAIMMAQILESKLAKKNTENTELSALLSQAGDLEDEQLAMKFNNVARSSASSSPLQDAYSDLISGNSPDAKKANRLMQEADKLREEKRTIEEDISYFRQQASQTRDRKLRKSFEDNVENLEADLKALNNKLDAKYNQAESLEAGKSLSAEEQAIAEELVGKQQNAQLSNLTVSDLDTEAIAKAAQKIRDKASGLQEVTSSEALANNNTQQASSETENEATQVNQSTTTETPENTSEPFQEKATVNESSKPKQQTESPREDVLDTPVEFKNALAQAAKIDNEYDREYQKREINQKWLSDINKDISFLRNELEYNPNTPNKADKLKKLTSLENQAENKRLDIMMSERIMSETAPESNKEILENALAFQAVQDIEDRFFFDYESLYDINNEQERLQAENEINAQYIEALTNHLNQATSFQEGEEAAVNQLLVAKKQRIQGNNKLINEKQTTGEEFVYQGDLTFEEPDQEEPIENEQEGTVEDNNSALQNQTNGESNGNDVDVANNEEQEQEVISVMPVELTQEAQLTNRIDSLNRAIRLKNEDLILANRRKDKKQIEADIIKLETEKNALETQLANLEEEGENTETLAQNEVVPDNQTSTKLEQEEGVENQEINPDFIEPDESDTAFEVGSSENFVAEEVTEQGAEEEIPDNTGVQAENEQPESSVSTEQLENTPANTRSNQSQKLSEAAKLKKRTEEIQDQIEFNQSAIRELEIQIDNTSKRKERDPLETELAQLQAKQEDLRAKAKLFYYEAKVAEVVGTRNQQAAADLTSELNNELEQSTSEVNSLDLRIRTLKDEIGRTIFKKNRLPLENELIIKKAKLVNQQSIIPEFQGFLDQLEPLLLDSEPLAEETSTNQSDGNFNEEDNQESVDQDEFLYKVPKRVERDIFNQDATTNSAYSIQNPIPIVNKLPQGLVYKVQIGAFRNPIPQETFKGFSPITGEKTSSGFIRYTAGYFKGFDKASVAKNEIRELGYRDAFVVAYFNGERISVSKAKSMTTDQALAATNNSKQGIGFEQSGSNSADNIGIQRVPRGQIDVKSVGDRGELFFTVQIGVYAESIDPNSTFEISPVNADRTGNGMIRYSSGVFNSVQAASSAKTVIQEDGIPDAFVTAYFKGERISISEAKRLMEERRAPSIAANTNTTSRANNTPDLSNVPAKTKVPEGELAYKVEIGPYQGEVPVSETEVILKYNRFGISLRKENNSTRYQVGEYVTFDDAQKLQNSLLNAGISTAKVIKLRNGEIIE